MLGRILFGVECLSLLMCEKLDQVFHTGQSVRFESPVGAPPSRPLIDCANKYGFFLFPSSMSGNQVF